MDTSFELPSQSIPAAPQPPISEPSVNLEAPALEEAQDLGPKISQQAIMDYDAEGESIMNIPGTPHEKLDVLSKGFYDPLKSLEESESKKDKKTKESKIPELSLEERVLKLQEELLKLMIAKMNTEKRDPKKEDEISKKLKQLLEEAKGEGSVNVMQSIMNITFMLYMISGEKSSRA